MFKFPLINFVSKIRFVALMRSMLQCFLYFRLESSCILFLQMQCQFYNLLYYRFLAKAPKQKKLYQFSFLFLSLKTHNSQQYWSVAKNFRDVQAAGTQHTSASQRPLEKFWLSKTLGHSPAPLGKKFSGNLLPSLESTTQKPHWSGPDADNPLKVYRQRFLVPVVIAFC